MAVEPRRMKKEMKIFKTGYGILLNLAWRYITKLSVDMTVDFAVDCLTFTLFVSKLLFSNRSWK